jgi:hypothetical protein
MLVGRRSRYGGGSSRQSECEKGGGNVHLKRVCSVSWRWQLWSKSKEWRGHARQRRSHLEGQFRQTDGYGRRPEGEQRLSGRSPSGLGIAGTEAAGSSTKQTKWMCRHKSRLTTTPPRPNWGANSHSLLLNAPPCKPHLPLYAALQGQLEMFDFALRNSKTTVLGLLVGLDATQRCS